MRPTQVVVLFSIGMAMWIAPADSMAQPYKRFSDEYAQQIKSTEVIGALGNDLFGDRTNLYTGSTEFAITDVSLPGNSALRVSIDRRFEVRPRNGYRSDGLFEDWELDLPYLYGIFAKTTPTSVVGWQVSTGIPNTRCSVNDWNFAGPPDAPSSGATNDYFTNEEYWYGNSLHVPGSGDQEMLVLDSTNPYRPSDGVTYYWVTQGQWFFSCLPATANGVVGEAFLARSPDGLIYRFDHFIRRDTSGLKKPLASNYLSASAANGLVVGPMAANESNLKRQEIRILPTRVEDRFGNWVTYTYDASVAGRLTRIQANDGRQIDLSYNSSGAISSVTDGSRTWTYAYTGVSPNINLTTVTLPDASTWQFNLLDLLDANIQYTSEPSGNCDNPGNLGGNAGVGTITHPSGAIGTFTFALLRHGLSYVNKSCMYSGPSYTGPYAWYPRTFDVVALTSKQLSGPGLTTATWTYAYGPANASWAQDCPTSTSCPRTRALTVTGPADWVRYTFGNKWAEDEGKLLKVETGNSASSILRVEDTIYQMDAAGMAYPAWIGRSPNMRGTGTVGKQIPVKQTAVTQQNHVFTWQVAASCGSSGSMPCFDTYARPTKVIKSSMSSP